MKRSRTRPGRYPGNPWLEGAFEELGVETSVPFAHGVLRGILVNPAMADPSKALFQILRTRTPLDRRPREVERIIEGLFCLGDGIVKSYLFDQDLPQAISLDDPSCPDLRTLCGRLVDLNDGFFIGLAVAPIPRECRIASCDAWVEAIVREAKACAKWHRKPSRFTAGHADPDGPRAALRDSLARIESNTLELGRHVAKMARRSEGPSQASGTGHDDCPICAAAEGEALKGFGRGRGAFVRH